MNIFLRELRAYRKSVLIWALSLSLLSVIFLMLFPAFTKDTLASQKVIEHFPLAIRQALDISLQYFFTIYGFFAYLLTFVGLAGAVQAMNIGVGIISKEVSGKTADFLLTKPVSRAAVITSKLLAAFGLILITNIVFSLVSLVAANIISTTKFDNNIFALTSATMFLIQIFFLALGILTSVIIPKIKSAISVSLPVVFSFFIIGTLGVILGNDIVKYVSPFKFFDTNYIISHKSYDPKYLMIEAVFIVVAIAISYIVYTKKDVKAAV